MAVTLLDVGPSESLSVALLQGFRITGMSLQASASEQRVVTVWAEDGEDLAYAIGILSEEDPITPVLPPVVASDESELVLRHDGVAATVRFYGIPNPPPFSSVSGEVEEQEVDEEEVDEDEDEDEEETVVDEEKEEAVVDEEEEEEEAVDDDGKFEAIDEQASWVEYRPLTEEEEAELYDSDNGEADEDGGGEGDKPPLPKTRVGEISTRTGSLPLVAARAVTVVPDGQFFGPARFTAVENTAGFMRLAAAAAEDGPTDQHSKEIIVLYRYTRFSRTWSGRRGVEACRRTKLHHLRFAVPPAGDMASSLAWAGASLGPLVYPALFRSQLQEMWAILAAPAAISTILPRSTRLQVILDVGILRREDYTQERMDYLRGALETEMQEAWPELYHVGMELHLPEPVQSKEEPQGEDARSAKRTKSDEEECSLCFYPLEGGLAAWPGCRHVFHGECVEKTLARSDLCPLCRTKLSDQFVR